MNTHIYICNRQQRERESTTLTDAYEYVGIYLLTILRRSNRWLY